MLAKKPKGATEKRQARSSASGLLWMFVGAVLTLMIGVFLYLSPLFDFNPTGAPAADPDRQIEQRVNTDTDSGDYEFYDILPSQEMATIPDEAIDESNITPSISIENFKPDAVVTQPEESNTNRNDNTGNSESTTESSQGASNNVDNANTNNNNDIVVIEESATYDGTTPSNNNSTSSNKISSTGGGTASVQKGTTYILQINSFGDADEADRRRAQVLMAGIDAKVVKNTSGAAPVYQVVSRPMNSRQTVASAQQRLQNNGIDSVVVEQRR